MSTYMLFNYIYCTTKLNKSYTNGEHRLKYMCTEKSNWLKNLNWVKYVFINLLSLLTLIFIGAWTIKMCTFQFMMLVTWRWIFLFTSGNHLGDSRSITDATNWLVFNEWFIYYGICCWVLTIRGSMYMLQKISCFSPEISGGSIVEALIFFSYNMISYF